MDACLKLLHEILFIKRNVPTMLIIDDYNGLYWRTDYGVWVNEKHRRMVGIEETMLVSPLHSKRHFQFLLCTL